jgi:hypothetical protein
LFAHLQKKLGPEYLALLEAIKNVDPDFKRRSGDCVDVRYARQILSALIGYRGQASPMKCARSIGGKCLGE